VVICVTEFEPAYPASIFTLQMQQAFKKLKPFKLYNYVED